MRTKREFCQCSWCGRSVDRTNQDRDLCDSCSKYTSKNEMIKAKIAEREKGK